MAFLLRVFVAEHSAAHTLGATLRLPTWHECWNFPDGHLHSWRYACCELLSHVELQRFCWSDLPREVCCAPERAPPKADSVATLEKVRRLQESLGFTDAEFSLFLDGVPPATSIRGRGREGLFGRPPCSSADACAKEGLLALYQVMLRSGRIPTRSSPVWWLHANDHLSPLWFAERERNDESQVPKYHELAIDRIQTAAFIGRVEGLLRGGRCLVWDVPHVGRLERICQQVDVIVYNGGTNAHNVSRGTHGFNFYTDIHESNIPSSSIDLVLCIQVFEHVRRPWLAMAEMRRILAAGGQVVWSTPFLEEVHESGGGDYWRLTPDGAHMLAEDAGFRVVQQSRPGGVGLVAGYMIGQNAAYWTPDDMVRESATQPLQVLMLLEKPLQKD